MTSSELAPLAFDPVLHAIGYGLAAEMLLECGGEAPEPEPAPEVEPETFVWRLPEAATEVEWFPEPAEPAESGADWAESDTGWAESDTGWAESAYRRAG